MPNYEIDCPTCHTPGVIVETGFDHNYGADADGNRGISIETIEVTDSRCECDFEDDAILWETVKAHNSLEDEPDFGFDEIPMSDDYPFLIDRELTEILGLETEHNMKTTSD